MSSNTAETANSATFGLEVGNGLVDLVINKLSSIGLESVSSCLLSRLCCGDEFNQLA